MSKHLNYSTIVVSLTGQRGKFTLQITGTDTQGAFDWCCDHRGLSVSADLEQSQEDTMMDTNPSYEYLNKWSWHNLWQRLTK
jgi:hypothetical protein